MADGPQLVDPNDYRGTYTSYDQSKSAQPDLIPVTETERQVPYTNGSKATYGTILGIRRRNFWILVALAMILVGATVGGSVGGSLAVQNKSKSSSEPIVRTSISAATPTPTPTPTGTDSLQSTSAASSTASSTASIDAAPYIPLSFSDISTIDITCPSTTIDSLQGTDLKGQYRYNCLGNSNIRTLPDIMALTVYTLQQCVDACSQYNDLQKNSTCQAAVVSSDVTANYHSGNGANCFLKYTLESTMRQENLWTAAVLIA